MPPLRLGRGRERAPDILDRRVRGSAASTRGATVKTNLGVLREASELLLVATKTLIELGGEQATGAVLEDLAWRVLCGRFLTGKQPPPRPPAGHA